ncbi:MAG: elongation factor G [Erysipelotrichaceae bacterium]|nr:elongation factor G [Erysipelotrichaceae bacterium]
MKDYSASQIRNVCLLGHSGSGKSTFAEAALFVTKVIDRMGKTADGSSVMDYDQEEVKKGGSVYTSIAPIEWKTGKINFLDTPGYLDYVGEMEAGLAVADGLLIMVSAKDGIQTGTEKAWRISSKKKIPTVFFINKLDEENASFQSVYNSLRSKFHNSIVAFELPIISDGKTVGTVNILKSKAFYYGENEGKEVPAQMSEIVTEHYNQIMEAVASADDTLMEKFFAGEAFTDEEVIKGLKLGVLNGEVRPVLCGSTINHNGIEIVLKTIFEYFPAFCEVETVKAQNRKGEEVILKTSEEAPFVARVFKTIIDPFVGRLSFIKVISGTLKLDTPIVNVQQDKPEKFNQISVMMGKNQLAVSKLVVGDIGVLTKLQYTQTNDTLATGAMQVILPQISFPTPMLGVAIEPKSKNDEDKMSGALQRILEEDPTCRIVKNAETKQTILYGVGDQHIDVLVSRLKNKYKVEIVLVDPKVQYRETIRGKAEVQGKHKKQSGGAGQFGDVWIRFEPCDSEEMVFSEAVFGGAVPRQYFPAVEVGLRECMQKGILAGYKVVGVKATLYDGSYHPVDSKEIAFKSAARLAYKAGMPKAQPILLEPIGKCSVYIPEEYTGTIIGDFNKRRGIIMSMDMLDDGLQCVTAEVPLAEMQKYATELRSMTQGRGGFDLSFDRYEPAPQPVADKVIAEAARNRVEEEED